MKNNKTFNSIRDYQIDTKDRTLRKEKKEINYRYNYSKTILKICFGFFIALLVLLSTPLILGNHYDYTTEKINEIKSLNNEISYSIKKIEYSEKDGMLRTDIQLINNSTLPVITNLKLLPTVKIISDRNTEIKNDLVKVSDDYYVLYANIKPNFEIGKVQIKFKKEQGSSLSSESLSDIEYYINEDDVKQVKSIKLATHKNLFIETKQLQIEEIQTTIKEIKKTIETEKEAQLSFEKSISSLEDEKKYSVGEEINEIEEKIKTNSYSIETSKEKEEELKEKIKALEKKKVVLETYIKDMEK